MTRRCWIADEVRGNRAYLLGAHAQNLSRVLRVPPSQEFDVSAGDQLRKKKPSIAGDRVEFELGEVCRAFFSAAHRGAALGDQALPHGMGD